MSEAVVVRRTIKYSNGVPLAVTNHAFARLLGFQGPSGSGTGHISALRLGFSASRQELYFRTALPSGEKHTYRLLESGVSELIRRGILVNDAFELQVFFDLKDAGHLYTDREGAVPLPAPDVNGIVGTTTPQPNLWVVDAPLGKSDPSSVLLDELSADADTPTALRTQCYQAFGEMMYQLALLQQWGGNLSGLNDDATPEDEADVDAEDRVFFEKFVEHRARFISLLDQMTVQLGVNDDWTIWGE